MSKKRNIAWRRKLRSFLADVTLRFVPDAGKDELAVLTLAINEIIAGTHFCLQNKINLNVTDAPDFCLAGSGYCILAKNSESKNYWRAIEFFGLTHSETGSLGFSCSSKMRSLISKTKLNWDKLYTKLWKKVDWFFLVRPHTLPG